MRVRLLETPASCAAGRRARIPNCRVEAGAGRQPVDLRRSADLSGVEGAEPLARPCRGRAKRGPKGYAGS